MTGKELIQLLQQNGWRIERIKGSHHTLSKGNQIVTVAVHAGQAVPTGTLNKILKVAGLK